MHLPTSQQLLTSGLALTNVFAGDTVSKGKVLDYAVEKCIDSDGNVRCSKPFLVTKDACYYLSWTTDGTFSHTTVEVRDAGSGEIVYYRDTDGSWKPEKNELVYLDFKPKIWQTGNDTVEYKVTSCENNEL
ncbi:hypothetical protein MY11210_008153 [Beauveria gryllotalpidicola]